MTTTVEESTAKPGIARPGLSTRPPPRWDRRWWFWAAATLIVWSVWSAGVNPSELINERGWTQVRAFFSAMWQPDLSSQMLRLVARESAVTAGYAVLGSALATAIGLVGGVLLTERIWSPQHGPMERGRWGWGVARVAFAAPRSLHEVVFGLLLINILGLDPLVGILAIGIPAGAVIAKVFAELLDDVSTGPEMALRAGGAGRLAAFVFGSVPLALSDLLSYSFYRFECALRSAAVLGIIGAGGLGFQLALSFQSLRYDEMWTFLWALILLSGLSDRWSSAVRRRRSVRAGETGGAIEMATAVQSGHDSASTDRFLAGSALAFTLAIPLAWWWLDIDVSTLWAPRARTLSRELVADAVPPSIGEDGWSGLISDSLNTIALAVLASALSFALAWPLALLAKRSYSTGRGTTTGRPVLRQGVGALVRLGLLICRAVPVPVWAFVVVFVLFPGPWPGAVGLAIYNTGVLGRLMAEVLENQDTSSARQLSATGASSTGSLAFATIPAVAGRFSALALYRWEVLIRETVIVGVVGAAGLGRRLRSQTVAFDYDGILATIVALFVVTMAVDYASARVRRTLR